VRENVVFGQPMDAALYHDVIRACALTDDLKTFPGTSAGRVRLLAVTVMSDRSRNSGLQRET
jgi:hypothetical protein